MWHDCFDGPQSQPSIFAWEPLDENSHGTRLRQVVLTRGVFDRLIIALRSSFSDTGAARETSVKHFKGLYRGAH